MKKKYISLKAFCLLSIILFTGCQKFLTEKSDRRLSTPVTIEDFQAMLNNYNDISNDFIVAGQVSSDEYYITDADFNALAYESDKRLYTWQPDYVTRPQSSGGDDWHKCYRAIFVCNSILQGATDNNLAGAEADNIKGQALVFRAARYLDGVQVWSPTYNRETANTDLGMVLRIDPDMNIASIRSTVQQTYDLIIKDLTDAVTLLQTKQLTTSLPTRAAAYGYLARTYLLMGEYENALQNAQNALENTSAQVINFNNLDPNAAFPIPTINYTSYEMILWTSILSSDHLKQSTAKITPELYSLYADDDLRKVIYFSQNADDTYQFKGTHHGYFWLTNSLTPAEMLLVIAECNVRLGNLANAADALNQLLMKRWRAGEFVPYTFTNKELALRIVLDERRKELVLRGLRWPDIKRLNRDGFNITLTRKVNGKTYTLPPNDLRYAIAIPETVIELGGIQQNPR